MGPPSKATLGGVAIMALTKRGRSHPFGATMAPPKSPPKKAPKKATVKLNSYRIITASIQSSIPAGIRKYYKYCDAFDPEIADNMATMQNWIYEYIMLDLSEVIDWDKC